MAGVLELWLVRHGETPWNAQGRVQGQSDPPLSVVGRAQAEGLAPRLAHTAFSAVYSSDTRRTTETARLSLSGACVNTDARLCELHFGAWEGRRWQDVAADDPDALSAWYADPYTCAPTGGEAYAALSERVRAWLTDLPPTGRVVAFTHGGPVRAVLYGLTGPPDAYRWRFDLGPTSLTKLVLGDQGAIIKTVGDTAHLENLAEDPVCENLVCEEPA